MIKLYKFMYYYYELIDGSLYGLATKHCHRRKVLDNTDNEQLCRIGFRLIGNNFRHK